MLNMMKDGIERVNYNGDKERMGSSLSKISNLRMEIDECDEILVRVFQRRMELVTEILENKRKNNLPILNPQREQEIMDKFLQTARQGSYAVEVEALLEEMLRISRRLQSKKLIPNNIVLAGFMGTGKSTIGKDLAKKLEMEYVDTDALIEKKANMPIKDIFEKYGEAYFRSMEKQTIEEISRMKNKIIICGGGVVLNKDNVMNLRKNGTVILLQAQPETIYERLKQDTSRPVLVIDGKVCLEKVEALLKQREEAYRSAADVSIQTDDKHVDEISIQIISLLYSINH